MFPFLQIQGESELRAGFRAAGAVSPARARPRKDLTLVDDAGAFDSLLSRGVIREGAPGTFYLYEPRAVPVRWAPRLLFWIALILIPVGIIQFCPGSP